MSKLDQLNEELQKLDLPNHRSKVEPNGSNVKWLQKHVAKKEGTPPIVTELLALPMKELLL